MVLARTPWGSRITGNEGENSRQAAIRSATTNRRQLKTLPMDTGKHTDDCFVMLPKSPVGAQYKWLCYSHNNKESRHNKPTGLIQPCIPTGSLNRVPALLGVKRNCHLCRVADDTVWPRMASRSGVATYIKCKRADIVTKQARHQVNFTV